MRKILQVLALLGCFRFPKKKKKIIWWKVFILRGIKEKNPKTVEIQMVI